jgi:L-alanine-DL-glutamate epimerase-like enolase superfamily enzyme
VKFRLPSSLSRDGRNLVGENFREPYSMIASCGHRVRAALRRGNGELVRHLALRRDPPDLVGMPFLKPKSAVGTVHNPIRPAVSRWDRESCHFPRAGNSADSEVGQGFENCREAIGWDHDIMVHCHWEYDLRTSIQLAQAVEHIKPLWLEDPLGVDYSGSWKRLVEASNVPICTGENLERREGCNDFIINQALDILNPDLRNSGGFLETKRIADMAEVYDLPIATHNTGSQLNTWATCQWAASIRDFIACETITGRGGWMDQLLQIDGPYIEGGFIRVNEKPGLGVELNPDVVKAHLAEGEAWWG